MEGAGDMASRTPTRRVASPQTCLGEHLPARDVMEAREEPVLDAFQALQASALHGGIKEVSVWLLPEGYRSGADGGAGTDAVSATTVLTFSMRSSSSVAFLLYKNRP